MNTENTTAKSSSHGGITDTRLTVLHRWPQGHQIDDNRCDEADDTADDAADEADGAGRGEEHHPDIGDVAAQGLHDADLPGTLGDGHDHGIGDAQRRHEQ